jgi:hypothetical protein
MRGGVRLREAQLRRSYGQLLPAHTADRTWLTRARAPRGRRLRAAPHAARDRGLSRLPRPRGVQGCAGRRRGHAARRVPHSAFAPSHLRTFARCRARAAPPAVSCLARPCARAGRQVPLHKLRHVLLCPVQAGRCFCTSARRSLWGTCGAPSRCGSPPDRCSSAGHLSADASACHVHCPSEGWDLASPFHAWIQGGYRVCLPRAQPGRAPPAGCVPSASPPCMRVRRARARGAFATWTSSLALPTTACRWC